MAATVPSIGFDLSGRARLVVIGHAPAEATYVSRQMEPFPAGPNGVAHADVVVDLRQRAHRSSSLVDIHGPAHDGLTTGFDGRNLYLLTGGRACSIPAIGAEEPARFTLDPGFPVRRIFGSAIRPVLQLAMHGRGAAAVHAASVEIDGGAVLVAGWSESGKTETALALVEGGASFLSDKWTIVGTDGEVSAFPTGVGIRRWVVRYLPTLRRSLPLASRAQFLAARAGASLLGNVAERSSGGDLGELLGTGVRRALALGDRVGLTLPQVRQIYGQQDDPARRVPLRAVVLLTNTLNASISAQQADAPWAARRLARSAAVERASYFALQRRASYADPESDDATMHELVTREERLLTRALDGAHVVSIHAPFPTDPRPVAAAIRAAL